MRTIIVGDVHGCYIELMYLLEKVRYDPYGDRLVFVGDLIDKGPLSYTVVSFVHTLKAEVVMGNHDEKMLRYWRHWQKKQKDPKYKIPMRFDEERLETFNNLLARDELLPWMAEFKPLIQLADDWVVVHAGLLPRTTLVNQDPKLIMRLRYVHKETGKMMPLNDDMTQPEGSEFWTEQWKGGHHVIYGHTAASLEDVRQGIGVHSNTFGIDTGCVYGGRLTAMVFEEDLYPFSRPKFIQVQAQKKYAPYYEQGEG